MNYCILSNDKVLFNKYDIFATMPHTDSIKKWLDEDTYILYTYTSHTHTHTHTHIYIYILIIIIYLIALFTPDFDLNFSIQAML